MPIVRRTQSRWSSIPKRKKAITLFNEGKTIKEISEELGLTYFQVYNVVTGRAKSNYGPRKDKGKKRPLLGAPIENEVNPTDATAFKDSDDFLKYQTFRNLDKLNASTLEPDAAVKVLKDCSKILSDIHNREMQRHLKRADAEIIYRIIKRYVPEAADEEVIRIYREELARYEAEAGQ